LTALTTEQELKVYLLAHGVSIDPEAERVWSERYQGPMSLSEYASTSGICLYTANGCYINVPFVESFTQASGARFIFDGEFAVVRRRSLREESPREAGPDGSLCRVGRTMMNRKAYITRIENDLGSRKLLVRIPAGSKAWCCSTDEGSFPRLEVRKAQFGQFASPEPEHFVPNKPTAGLD